MTSGLNVVHSAPSPLVGAMVMERVRAKCSEKGASPMVQSALSGMASEMPGLDNTAGSGDSMCIT